MKVDTATRDVLRDIAAYPALLKGDPDITKIRDAYNVVFAAWSAPSLSPTEESWTSGEALTHLKISPLNASPENGTIAFIHGGGWSLGNALCYAPLARHLSGISGMQVLVPDFPQSPEAPFPAALDALRSWLTGVLDAAEGPVFLAGDSAGGTLCAVLGHEDGIAGRIAGQGLLYPVIDLRPDARYRSRRRYGGGKFFLNTDGILGAAMMYTAAGADPRDSRVSPLFQEAAEQSPPSFFLFPECDPLKDEGEAYAQKLKKAGVPVEVFLARRTIHGCCSFGGRIPQGREGIERMATFFRSLVERG